MTQISRHRLLPKKIADAVAGCAVLFIALTASAWIGGGSFLLTRQLWMDEVHSWLLVTDPNPVHAMRALCDGVDFNPPTWFMVTRWLTELLQARTEAAFRLLSLCWMLTAVVGMYILLSRRFSAMVSGISSTLVMSHPLLIHQSTEIRFYSFWCMCIVWNCVALSCQPQHRSGRWLQFQAVAVLSALTSTTHYFGILSLMLTCLAVAGPSLFQRRWRSLEVLLAAIAMVAGSAALGFCLPVMAGQRSALTRPTWISPATLTDTVLFLQAMYPVWPVVLCTLAAVFSGAFIASGKSTEPASAHRAPKAEREAESPVSLERSALNSIMPLASLAAMPLVIALVAWTLQPALVTRYAIVGVFGTAPLFAFLLQSCSRRMLTGIAIISVATLTLSVHRCVLQWKTDADSRDRMVQELRKCPKDALLICENRIVWMPILHHYPDLSNRLHLADFETDQLTQDSNLRIVQRDVGRKIQRWYPRFAMRSVDSLARESSFYLIPYAGGTAHDLRYPQTHHATQVSASVYRLSRTPLIREAKGEN